MISKKDAERRIGILRKEIEHHRYLYHVLDKQEISDAALDSLKNELQTLEMEYPDLITPDSPTQRVGGEPLPEFQQVEHRRRMLSLQDVFSAEEIYQWMKRNEKIVQADYDFFVELKIDGVAVSLIYEDGRLTQAATRGNGLVGEDVTHNIRTIDAIPLELRGKHSGRLEVRGEVYMLKTDFEKMNERRQAEDKPLFANPRNVAAGSIRQLDPAMAKSRPLRFFAWEITDGSAAKTRAEEWKELHELGFATPPQALAVTTIEELQEYIEQQEKKRLSYPFQVDGLVVKVNDLQLYKRLGVVGKAPRGAIAYKFAAEEATTIVEDIVVQVGRTGKLTPVAHLVPVSVAGTTVSRATLHNEDEIRRKDVRVGDTVIIRKAGDIIPEVVSVMERLRPKKTKPFSMPNKCPICGSVVVKEKNGVVTRCTNAACFSQQRERVLHAVSKAAFDIEGLGEKIIEQLLQEGLIENPAELWELTEGDLLVLEGFAEKKTRNLVEEIQGRKKIPLRKFLVALSIPNVGVVTAQDMAQRFQSLGRIQKATLQEFESIDGIGEKVAHGIYDFFHKADTLALLQAYKDAGIKVEDEKPSGSLYGKTFLFTGSLPDMTRSEAKNIVQERGGRVASAVGKEVDYVVVGDVAGSKEKKARALGLTVLTPQEFMKIIEQ